MRPGWLASAWSSRNSRRVSCSGRPSSVACQRNASRESDDGRGAAPSTPDAERGRTARTRAAARRAGRERLADVVVRAELQPEQAIDLLDPGGQHDDGAVGAGARLAQDL